MIVIKGKSVIIKNVFVNNPEGNLDEFDLIVFKMEEICMTGQLSYGIEGKNVNYTDLSIYLKNGLQIIKKYENNLDDLKKDLEFLNSTFQET